MSKINFTTADLRCRVNIDRKVLTSDGQAGNNISYTTFATVWAYIEQWKGREAYRAERTEGLTYQRVVIRAGTTVLDSDVVVFNGKSMPVKYMNDIESGKVKYLELICVQGDPTGGVAS